MKISGLCLAMGLLLMSHAGASLCDARTSMYLSSGDPLIWEPADTPPLFAQRSPSSLVTSLSVGPTGEAAAALLCPSTVGEHVLDPLGLGDACPTRNDARIYEWNEPFVSASTRCEQDHRPTVGTAQSLQSVDDWHSAPRWDAPRWDASRWDASRWDAPRWDAPRKLTLDL